MASEDRQTPLDELHPRDKLQGLRAVMLERTGGDLADIGSAIELFNYVIECAIDAVDNHNPCSYIRIQTAKEFGPGFVDGLLESIERLQQTWRHDPYDRFIGERFKPLKPILDMLQSSVQHGAWPLNDLSLGPFLLMVDYFKKVTEEDWRCV